MNKKTRLHQILSQLYTKYHKKAYLKWYNERKFYRAVGRLIADILNNLSENEIDDMLYYLRRIRGWKEEYIEYIISNIPLSEKARLLAYEIIINEIRM